MISIIDDGYNKWVSKFYISLFKILVKSTGAAIAT